MRLSGYLLALMVLASPLARAAELRVQVVDAGQHPVADAVVTLTALDPAAPASAVPAPPRTQTIDQREEAFIPYVAVFRPGDSVVFRNSDVTRHHVYSFSPAKTFEFVVKPGQSSPALRLDQAGIVAVGCNIHDHMRTWLFVTSAPWVAVSDAHGQVRFDGLAAGQYRVVTWHPQLRPRQPEVATTATVSAAPRVVPVQLTLLPDPRQPMDHSRMQY